MPDSAAQPVQVVAELAARPRRRRVVEHAAVVAEDEHADPPAGEAGARQQAAGEQLDVVAVRADEQNALGKVHAGFRPT